MKKLIIKTNCWFDCLKEPQRTLFFFIVIMGGTFVASYLFYVKDFIWAYPIWFSIICFWRVGYIFIKAYDNYKKQ